MPDRHLKISMSPRSGTCNRFYAFLDGVRVIAEDGNAEATFEDDVPAGQVRLQVRVFGIANAEYELGVDLPGTADDQSLTLQLSQGYHELELHI